MTTRTKRYGGFLVGDRVRFMHTEGKVIDLRGGSVIVLFHNDDNEPYALATMPNQLTNLTREEEDERMDFTVVKQPSIADIYSLENVLKTTEQIFKSEETDLLAMTLGQIKDLKKEIANKVEQALEGVLSEYERKYQVGHIAIKTSRYMSVLVTDCGEELAKDPKHETEITFTREEE